MIAMPIHLREPPDPTAAAGTADSACLAESEAYRRLCRELERYVRREITGRSFLVSGHRGSGKTTMVLKAYEDVYWSFNQRLEPHSPVLVRLQGPDLLPDSEAPPTCNGAPITPRHSAAPETPGKSERELAAAQQAARVRVASAPGRALRQITLAMYRAVAERFAAELRERVKERQGSSSRQEGLELAASFRLLLDDAPSPRDLREIYRRGGFLEKGVLFSPMDSHLAAEPPPADQGMRELVALASAAQAYRLILFEMTGERTSTAETNDEQSRSVAVQPTSKEALEILAGLMLGGIVGAGVLSGDSKAAVAGLAAAGTAAAATLVLKFGSARSRKRTVKEEDKLTRRYDASTLERELPILVERLHQAGLAPVFMVDELDKVRSLQELMMPVVDQLKGFVSERAFFCFLTDRDYFEHLRSRLRTEPYPREHTYFADRIFVLYRPEDLHRYLTGPEDEDGAPEISSQRGILEMIEEEPADRTTRAVLPYLLLHRAKMHPADLRRELQRMRNAAGFVTMSRSALRSDPIAGSPYETPGALTTNFGYRFAVTIQLAVEHLLYRDELRRRIDLDPHFAQSACDSLYYISRKWEEGSEKLDLSEVAFSKYMSQRITPDQYISVNAANPERNASETNSAVERVLPATDRKYLYHLASELAALLLEPKRLLRELAAARTHRPPKAALDAVPVEYRLFEPLDETTDSYAFCCDPYGRSLRPGATEEEQRDRERLMTERTGQETEEEVGLKKDFILDLDAFVRELTDTLSLYTLADELGVLSTSPAWPQVSAVLNRLEAFIERGDTYAALSEDLRVLADYGAGLCRKCRILAFALLYGSALGPADPSEDAKRRRANGVRTLAQGLRLPRLSSEKCLDEIVESYVGTVRGDVRTKLNDVGKAPELAVGKLEEWKKAVQTAVGQYEYQFGPEDLTNLQDHAWNRWRERFRRHLLQGVTKFDPEEQDLLCGLAGRMPSTLLQHDLTKMSLADWSRVLLLSLDGRSQSDPELCPVWVAPVALVSLKLGDLLVDCQGMSDMITRVVAESGTEVDLDNWAEVVSWARRPSMLAHQGSARCVVVILSRETDSLTESWLPGRRYGAVCLPQNLLASSAVSRLLKAASELKAPTILFVEMEPRVGAAMLRELVERTSFPESQIVLLSRSREILAGVGKFGFSHSVVRPQDIDDAVGQALRVISPV